MRNIYGKTVAYALLSLLLFTGVHANGQKGKTEISGTINLDSSYVMIISAMGADRDGTTEVPLSANGKFKWSTKIDAPTWFQVSFVPKKMNRQLGASFPVYLKPKRDQVFQLNYTDSTYLSVSKKGCSAENAVLIQYGAFSNKKLRDSFVSRPSDAHLEPFLSEYLTKYDELQSTPGFNEPAVKEYLKIWAYNDLLAATARQERKAQSSMPLPADLLKTLDSDFTLLFYNGIANVDRCLLAFLPEHGHADRLDLLETKVGIAQGRLTTKALSEKLIELYIDRFIRSYKIVDAKQFNSDIARFDQLTKSLFEPVQQQRYVNNLRNLQYTQVGSYMPDVAFRDLSGNDVHLAQFKGKYVYIDLWASWCVPCIREVPYLKEIEKQYEAKNIEFVSISLDDNKTAWRNKVSELDLHGNQWELGESGYDKLMNVRGIPHFILYGPDGKLLLYDAPRPSSKQLRDYFEQIL